MAASAAPLVAPGSDTEEEGLEDWLKVEAPIEYDRYGFRRERDVDELHRPLAARDARLERAQARRWNELGWRELVAERAECVRGLVRQGIPNDLRPAVWQALAQVDAHRARHAPGYFGECAERGARARTEATAQIELDVDRTFPGHKLFDSPEGAARLRTVLCAFAEHNPHIGYVQGMGFLCAVLLLFSPDEAAFWLLVAVAESLLPLDYYTPSMLGLRTDQRILESLVCLQLPRLGAHLQRQGVGAALYSTKWLLCVFTSCLPTHTMLRVWDVFFYEGNSVLFRVALALLKLHERVLLRCDDQGEILALLNAAARTAVDAERVLALAFSQRLMGPDFCAAELDRLRAQALPAVQAEGAGVGGVPVRVRAAAPAAVRAGTDGHLADTKVAHRRAVAAAATVRRATVQHVSSSRQPSAPSPMPSSEGGPSPPAAFTYVAIGRQRPAAIGRFFPGGGGLYYRGGAEQQHPGRGGDSGADAGTATPGVTTCVPMAKPASRGAAVGAARRGAHTATTRAPIGVGGDFELVRH